MAYAIAASVGIGAIFLSPGLWPVPLLSMVAYYVFGHDKAKDGGTIFEFADSVYYLGFTLSIGSLVVSLDPFSLRGNPDPKKIFHLFGLGLLTTLVGVVLRTVVQQFYRLPSESIEAANRRVGEEINDFVAELSALRQHVVAHAGAAVSTYKGQLLPQLEELVDQASQVSKRFEGASNVASVIEEKSRRVANAVDRLGTAFEGAAAKIDADYIRLTDAHRELASQLVQASQTIELSGRTTASGLNEVRTAASGSAAGLGTFAQGLRPLFVATDELRHALAAVTHGIAEASTSLHEGIDALKIEAQELHGTAGSIQRSSAAIETVDIGSQLAQLAAHVERLGSSIGEQQRLTAQETGALNEAVTSALDACRRLHEAVQEIAAALAVRIDANI